MKKIAVSVLVAGLALGAGCVRTVAPIVESKDRIVDPTLAGEWVSQENPKEFIRIEAPGADKKYRIETIDEEGNSFKYTGWLGRVGELMVAEITPEELPEKLSIDTSYYLRLYSFYVILATKPELRIGSLDADWLQSYLKTHPGELNAMGAHQDPIGPDVVTSPPETIRAFLLRHVKDEGAVSEAVFVRREVKK